MVHEVMRAFYIVHGFVQGVGYRAFVSAIAKKYGVNGFVRNVSDGSVEVLAIGSKKLIKEFEKEINAVVGRIEVLDIEKKYKGRDKLSKECANQYDKFIVEKTKILTR